MADNYTVYLYPYTLTASSHSDLYTGDVFPHAVLHDPSIPGRFLMQLPLEMAESKSGSFSFTITPDNPLDRKSTRLNSSHPSSSRMPSSA